jgi:hypothetical protein
MPREKVEGIGEDGKAERGEQEASATSFFSGGRQLRVPLAAYVAILNRLYDAKEGWSKARGPTLTESQKRLTVAHRNFFADIITPVALYLQSLPVERRLI